MGGGRSPEAGRLHTFCALLEADISSRCKQDNNLGREAGSEPAECGGAQRVLKRFEKKKNYMAGKGRGGACAWSPTHLAKTTHR